VPALPPPPPQAPDVAIRTRQASTTIDALEKEFQRKKARELEAASRSGGGDSSEAAQRRTGEKVGRNDPCPCGSGKKYKKCHGEK
jgi:preprotein translocase subunit SecA